MKIDSTTSTATTVGETRNRGTISKPTGGNAAEVHLSELASQLQATADPATFDANRVTEIKQAIADGRFTKMCIRDRHWVALPGDTSGARGRICLLYTSRCV